MEENKYKELLWVLQQLKNEYPNDMELGKKVRELIQNLQNDN